MKKIVRLDDLHLFVRTAQAGSFSAAARQLNVSPAFASGAIQRLERELGLRLFIRSTRRLRLSDDGERYLPHARAALEALTSGEQALEAGRADVAGLLRLSMPSDLGRNVLLPWLDAFQAKHPQLSLQLRISDQMADFFGESLDASLRYGVLADSNLVSLPICPSNRRTVCASPDYLSRHGRPRTLAALQQHNCLRYVMGETLYDRWSFEGPGGTEAIQVTGDRVSDDADIVRRWAVAGAGIVYKSRLDVLPDIQAGRLVELFPIEYGQPAPLQLVCAHRSSLTPAIQSLRQHLIECSEAWLKRG